MKRLFSMLFLGGICSLSMAQNAVLPIIPKPQQAASVTGNFSVAPSTVVVADSRLQNSVNALNRHLQQYYGFVLKTATKANANSISLALNSKLGDVNGAYTLDVTSNGVKIVGHDESGVFYGIQSLLQLMPPAKNKSLSIQIPAVSIQDAPRFGYRGMMLDVARHFEPIEFVKKTIDRLAMLKINTFHWHLTEDQGWRIEIKKYPKLTEVGAWRDGTIIGRYPGTGNDNKRHGGFYTQEQVKEIVQYAAERYITVIPEIEMPGHSSAAIAAYPFLSCFPEEETKIPRNGSTASQSKKGKKVQETWGVFEDVYVPSEQTFQFLQDVIDEIVPLFPGKYIHIGGDECPKEAWKRSAFCQQLIKEKGLKDEHELQSYFIQRMEKYINSKGKQIIGWDEILEGGLAPNATVMSWRGEKGGIDAAKQNHDVIMSPNSHCYLDHSQSKNEDSVTIGGFTTVDKLYSYDPVPAELKGTAYEKYVQGVQGNVWTEYMSSPSKVEYMIFPRVAALSEAAWTKPENKSWDHFAQRIPNFFQRLQMMQTNYSKAFYEINTAIEPAADGSGVLWKLDTRNSNAKLFITAPGGTEMLYTTPVPVTTNGQWKAVMKEGNTTMNTVNQVFALHKATGKKITVAPLPAKRYGGNGGVVGLVNAASSQKGLSSAEWCGWEGKDFEAIIDLGAGQPISEVVLHTIESQGSWIYRPASFAVHVSADGNQYSEAGNIDSKDLQVSDDFRTLSIKTGGANARFIKVTVKNFGDIPTGMQGAGHKAWLFVDEIEVK